MNGRSSSTLSTTVSGELQPSRSACGVKTRSAIGERAALAQEAECAGGHRGQRYDVVRGEQRGRLAEQLARERLRLGALVGRRALAQVREQLGQRRRIAALFRPLLAALHQLRDRLSAVRARLLRFPRPLLCGRREVKLQLLTGSAPAGAVEKGARFRRCDRGCAAQGGAAAAASPRRRQRDQRAADPGGAGVGRHCQQLETRLRRARQMAGVGDVHHAKHAGVAHGDVEIGAEVGDQAAKAP